MTTRKFNDHRYAQACVCEYDNGDKALVSYSTCVATIVNGWLLIDRLYSATTRKHIGWFMRELGLSYQTAKQLYEDHMVMNIYTDEVKGF